MIHLKHTRLAPFDIPFVAIVGHPSEVDKYMKKKFGTGKSNMSTPGFGGGVALLKHPLQANTPTIVMVFPEFPEAEAVAHEAIHVLFCIQKVHGIEIGAGAEEWMAYMIGYIVQEVVMQTGWREVPT